MTDVLDEMVEFLVAQKLIPLDLKEKALSALLVREGKLSTAVGDGLAIPHASIGGLPDPVVIVAKSEKGILHSSPDGKPIYLFFLVLVPSHDYGAHLRTLAQIGKFLSQPSMKQKLCSIQEPSDLVKLFKSI